MSIELAMLIAILAVIVIFVAIDRFFSYWTPGDDDEQDS